MSEEESKNGDGFSKRIKLTPKKSCKDLTAVAAAPLSKLTPVVEPILGVDEAEPTGVKRSETKVAAEPAGTESDLLADIDATCPSSAARRGLKILEPDKEQDPAVLFQTEKKFQISSFEQMSMLAESFQISTFEQISMISEEPKIPKVPEPQNFPELPNVPQLPKVPKISKVPGEKLFNITVNYLSEIASFICFEDEEFRKIYQDIANQFKLKTDEFVLTFRGKNIAPTDTPKSLSSTGIDTLDLCLVETFKFAGQYMDDEKTKGKLKDDEDTLLITFRSSALSKTDMIINKTENFKRIMNEYSKMHNVPLSDLSFYFDGVKLTGNETPADLDMEKKNWIDVVVFEPVAHCSKTFLDEPVLSGPIIHSCKIGFGSPIAHSSKSSSEGPIGFSSADYIPFEIDEPSDMELYDEYTLKIGFQSNDLETKTFMIVHKMETLQCIMTRYAAERNLPLDELAFEFDGQILTGYETPAELEMEHGNIIDVTICGPVGMSSESTESSVGEQDDNKNDKDSSYECDVIFLD